MSSTDRIEKDVVLRAPRARVWEAIGDSAEFGTWFRCRFDGPFRAGEELRGTLEEPGHEGTGFVIFVERVEPGRHLSFRWHAEGVDLQSDYASEPTTLVSFDLEDAPDPRSPGVPRTRLRIVESGFDALPAGVGVGTRERNAEGWAIQAGRISEHVAKAA